jgi:hypothetical protein
VQTAPARSLGPLFDLVEDGLELGSALGATEDEKLCQQGDILHIKQDDIGAQPIGNGIHNDMSEFDWFQDSTSVLLSFCRADHLSIRAS